MADSILIAVHPGYAANRGLISDRYGNYDEYLSRLRDAVWSQDSIIFLSRRDKPPFELPGNAEVMHDFDRKAGRGVNAKRIISRLKDRVVSEVEVGGEFLWHYYHFGSLDERYRKAYEGLSEEEQAKFIDDAIKFALGLDVDPITQLNIATGKAIDDGCEKLAYDTLNRYFNVRLRRDLSYPTIEPQQFSLEDIANFPLETLVIHP